MWLLQYLRKEKEITCYHEFAGEAPLTISSTIELFQVSVVAGGSFSLLIIFQKHYRYNAG